MIEIQQFPINPQTQSPQLHTLPASALPLAPQEHLLQTSRNSYRALARWESKKIYQTDSLAWLRCYCRRYQLISKLSPLLYKYLCSAISFYLISLLSPLFYFFSFPYCIFFFLLSNWGEIWGLIGARCKVNVKGGKRKGETEAHSLWLHDL